MKRPLLVALVVACTTLLSSRLALAPALGCVDERRALWRNGLCPGHRSHGPRHALRRNAQGGVFKSTDSGGTWTAANTGLTSRSVYALAIDPTSPATLYAGTHGGGVFKSTDSGGTWAAANTGLTMTYERLRPGHRSHVPRHALRRTGYPAGSSSPPTPAAPGPPPTRAWTTSRQRPGHRSHDPRHALRRDGRRRGLQVHQLRRHLGRRQHGPDEPVRPGPGHRSHDPLHALRRDVRRAGSSSPPTPAAPGPPPTRA